METTKHTPGPWTVGHKGNVIAHGGNITIAKTGFGNLGQKLGAA
jgi:hypothetical protein